MSGTLGLAGGQVPATAEARNALNNIKGTLEDYAAVNEVYRRYFEREFPARAFVGAGPLLFGARFEVLGIAVKR